MNQKERMAFLGWIDQIKQDMKGENRMKQRKMFYYRIQKTIGQVGDDRHDEALKLADYLVKEHAIMLPCGIGDLLFKIDTSMITGKAKVIEYEVNAVAAVVTEKSFSFRIKLENKTMRVLPSYESYSLNGEEDLEQFFFRCRADAENAIKEMEALD